MFLRIVLMDAKQLQAVIDSLPPPAAAATTASSASDAPKSVKLAAQDSRVEVHTLIDALYVPHFYAPFKY